MNEYITGVILGFVQGVTEFLPVSSSGHLILLETLGVGEPDMLTNLLLHAATLLAVIIAYRKRIWYLIKHPLDKEVKMLLIATIPTACLAGVIRFLLPDMTVYLPFCFMATTVILLLPRIFRPKQGVLDDKPTLIAIIAGLAQGVACINGISRSGSTTVALKMCGVNDEDSAEISFLLSIPIIIGSSIVEIVTNTQKSSLNGGTLLGMLIAFLVGIVAIKSFVAILKKNKFHLFAIYTFFMGIFTFALYSGN